MNFNNELNQTQEQELAVFATSQQPIEIKPEYISTQIVKLFNMLNNDNAPIGKRDSIIGIWKSLTNIHMPKAIGTQLRKELENIGFKGSANSSISTFKDLESYKGLVQYAIFTDTSYKVPKLDETYMSSAELTMYKEACDIQSSLPIESDWERRLKEYGLSLPSEYNDVSITVTGQEIEYIERKKLDIAEVTDYLPEDTFLIEYRNTAYIYVTTPCAMKMTLKNISLMPIDIIPIFYKTFKGGTFSDEELEAEKEDTTVYPPCEDLHIDSFFSGCDEDKFLEIQTAEAYIYLIKRGVYQKYNQLSEYNGDNFYIIRSYLLDGFEKPSADEVKADLESGVFIYLDSITDIATLEFIKKDLIDTAPVKVDDFITEVIDAKILLLS